MKATQLMFIRSVLINEKSVSRNFALNNYISRLSAIIHHLRHKNGMAISGKWVGNDYIYSLEA